MSLNTKMPDILVPYYQVEIRCYNKAIVLKDYKTAWYHIERAHIIGQRFPWQHTETHWNMLYLGLMERNWLEVTGQVIRLLLGAPISFINKVPVGNVGSTRVSMLLPQKVPYDIDKLLSKALTNNESKV